MLEYQAILKHYNFREWIIAKGKFSLPALLAGSLLLFLTLPVFIYGFLANIIPFYMPVFIARTKNQGYSVPQYLQICARPYFFPG